MDLYRRIVVSSITVAIIVFLIVYAFHPLFQYFIAGMGVCVAGIAIWEYEQFVKAKGGKITVPALVVLSMAGVLSFFLHAKNPKWDFLPFTVFFASFLVLFALHFKRTEGAIINLAVSSFGLLYIAVPIGMILGVLFFSKVDGRWWMTYLLVVTKITDIGAYFAGSLWGARKLAPNISPKKTVEGALFGLVCAVLASFIFYLFREDIGLIQLSGFSWLALGFILGIVGQFGDLSESLLKRDAQKKDSNTLPGLGGVLDSIDSVQFNAIIIFIYLHCVNI